MGETLAAAVVVILVCLVRLCQISDRFSWIRVRSGIMRPRFVGTILSFAPDLNPFSSRS